MANISSGTIVPYAKINDTWFKGSDLNDLMETLSEISYDSDGIINDNFIGICGRWSVYSTYHDYLIHWEVYKSLKKIMAQYSIQQLKIFYSDIEEGIGFMDFGEIVINYNDDDIIVMGQMKNLFPEINVLSWREYNRSFFGTLRVEKNILMLLVCIIFVVVGINIYKSSTKA